MLPVSPARANPSEMTWHERVKGTVFTTHDDDLLSFGGIFLTMKIHIWVVVWLFFKNFTPIPGEMIQFDEHIFQMGWFNHELENR